MALLSSPLDILKVLPKTNCRQCEAATCLAFAVEVLQGRRRLADCPHLGPEVLAGLEVAGQRAEVRDEDQVRALGGLQAEVAALDLAEVAPRLRGRLKGDSLAIPCLGKEFLVSPRGEVSSAVHVNSWVAAPLLSYVLTCAGREPVGDWLPLRDLPGGEDWYRLFGQRCEKPLKVVMDGYTGLFEYMIGIFAAKRAPASFDSDIAVVIRPLPLVPILLCYWKPDDGMESSLHMFFDRTATDNLNIESLYTLGVGLVTMFEKISRTHGR